MRTISSSTTGCGGEVAQKPSVAAILAQPDGRTQRPEFSALDFRVYLKQSGYRKSYILRYLEEALSETYGQLRAYGLGGEQFIKGLKFPLGTKYEITIVQLGEEARGILLGPITVGRMVYNVFEGDRTESYEQSE